MKMGKIYLLLAVLACGGLMQACQTRVPIDQSLYDACVDPYNREFRSRPGARSMVAGSGYGSTSCFWVWGAANQQEADARALANCRKEKGLCEVFADTKGLVAWTRRISDNGGYSPGPPPAGADLFARTSDGLAPRYSSPVTSRSPSISAPPRSSVSAGGDAYGCFNERQNRIVAQFTPRVQQAVGICQSANISRDMWQAVVNAAVACKMPSAAIAQFRANVVQSQQAAANSCVM